MPAPSRHLRLAATLALALACAGSRTTSRPTTAPVEPPAPTAGPAGGPSRTAEPSRTPAPSPERDAGSPPVAPAPDSAAAAEAVTAAEPAEAAAPAASAPQTAPSPPERVAEGGERRAPAPAPAASPERSAAPAAPATRGSTPAGAPASRPAAPVASAVRPTPPPSPAPRSASARPAAPPVAPTGTIRGKVESTPPRYLEDTVVYLKEVPGPFPSRPPLFIDQKGLKFIPHVIAVAQGETVRFLNHDGLVHNVYSMDGEGYNLGAFKDSDERSYRFKHTGIYSQLCSLHPEMLAYVFVGQNPYAAPVDRRGNYEIKGVPPGTYRLAVWNSHLKAPEQTVTVGAGGTVEQHFTVRR